MSKKRAAIANYLFGISNVAIITINGILLVPLYLQHLSLAVYGAWLASGNIILFFSILDSGIGVVLTHRLANALERGNKKEYSELACSAGVWIVFIGILMALIGIIISGYVPAWLHIAAEEAKALGKAVILAALAGGLSVINQTLGAIPQANQNTVGMGVVMLASVVAGTIGNIVALFLGYGVVSLGVGLLVRAVTQLLGYLFVIVNQWKGLKLPPPKWSYSSSTSLFKQAAPMFLARISNVLGQNSEAALTAILISPVAAAVLSITWRVAMVVRIAADQVGSAVFAGFSRIHGSGNLQRSSEILRRILTIFFAVLGPGLGLVIGFNKPIVTLWVGADKYGGDLLTILIAVTVVVGGTVNLVAYLLQAIGYFKIASLSEFLEVAARLALIIILTKLLGIYGIVVGGLVAFIVVKLWLLPRRLAEAVKLPPSGVFRLFLKWAPSLIVYMAIGLIWRLVIRTPDSWARLAVSMSCFVVIMGITLLFNRDIREEISKTVLSLVKTSSARL